MSNISIKDKLAGEQFCYDANNNDNNCKQSEDQSRKKTIGSYLENNNPNERENLMNTSMESWQLLEAEESASNGRSTGKSSISEKIFHEDGSETISDKTTRKQYVEVNPLGPQAYSPRLAYLCTAIYSLLPLASFLFTFTLIALLFTRYFIITLLYLGYIFWDRNTCNKGGKRIDVIYRSKFWSHIASYFPIKFRYTKQFELKASENYILNYHPHGISAFGAVTAFATNGLKFSELFPGIVARFMVHETSFVIPIMRETFALRGDCSVNSKSIDYILDEKRKKGNLLTIVGGGLAEADLSDAEQLKIVAAQRKGFVKKALIHGANLIPCIAFGENSVFKKVNFKPNSFLHRLESRWYEIFKFKHPIYYGASIITNKSYGLMPYRRPITLVMGDPIHVRRVSNPTQKEIDDLHSRYLIQLRAMYEANNDLCSKYDRKLEIV